MITLYTMRTGNGYRASIMLEEAGLPYAAVETDVRPGAVLSDAFRAASPLGKIPAIVDHDTSDGRPIAVAESLAIAVYLAEKTGKLAPKNAAERALAMQWATIVSSGFGAAITGVFFARQLGAEAHQPLIDKYFDDIAKGFAAMDRHLGVHPYLAGETYSFADVLAFPLLATATIIGGDPSGYPALQRWGDEVGRRPAVQAGLKVPPVPQA